MGVMCSEKLPPYRTALSEFLHSVPSWELAGRLSAQYALHNSVVSNQVLHYYCTA